MHELLWKKTDRVLRKADVGLKYNFFDKFLKHIIWRREKKYSDYRDTICMVVCVFSRQRRPYVSSHGNRNISWVIFIIV